MTAKPPIPPSRLTSTLMADNLRTALGDAREVFTFGLDGITGRRSKEGAPLGLDMDTFFAHLFVSRPNLESTITPHVGSDKSIWITGPIGCGKSTMAYKLAFDYNSLHGLPIMVVDFKTEQMPVNGREPEVVWSNRITEELQRGLKKIAHSAREISLLATLHAEHLTSPSAIATVNALENEWRSLAPERKLHDWLESLARKAERSSVEQKMLDMLDTLYGTLSPPDLLMLFRRKPTARPLLIIDSLDNISDIKLRLFVRDWLRDFAEANKDRLQLIVCVRPDNAGAFRKSLPTPAEPDDYELHDEASICTLRFGLHPFSLSADAEEVLRGYEAMLTATRVSSQHSESPQASNENLKNRVAFESAMIKKRLDYLDRYFTKEQAPGVDARARREAVAAFNEIRDINTVQLDLLLLSNGNRRLMFSTLFNFLEYCVCDLQLEWSRLGRPDGERPRVGRRQAIMGIYYRWLASGTIMLTGTPQRSGGVFSLSAFDLVTWTEESGWHRRAGRYGSEPRARNRPTIDALGQYYVLCGLYNLSGNTISARYRHHVGVRNLCERCGRLGISDATIVRHLTDFVRRSATEFGLIEVVDFLAVYNRDHDVLIDDHVWLTDRGCRLLEHTGFMYSFVVECLRHTAQKRCDRLAQLDDSFVVMAALEEATAPGMSAMPTKLASNAMQEELALEEGVVTQTDVEALLDFVRKAITTELSVVASLSASEEVTPESLSEYHELFCVKYFARQRTEPYLWSHRVLRSSMRFLEDLLDQHDRGPLGRWLPGELSSLQGIDVQLTELLYQVLVKGKRTRVAWRPFGR